MHPSLILKMNLKKENVMNIKCNYVFMYILLCIVIKCILCIIIKNKNKINKDFIKTHKFKNKINFNFYYDFIKVYCFTI